MRSNISINPRSPRHGRLARVTSGVMRQLGSQSHVMGFYSGCQVPSPSGGALWPYSSRAIDDRLATPSLKRTVDRPSGKRSLMSGCMGSQVACRSCASRDRFAATSRPVDTSATSPHVTRLRLAHGEAPAGWTQGALWAPSRFNAQRTSVSGILRRPPCNSPVPVTLLAFFGE